MTPTTVIIPTLPANTDLVAACTRSLHSAVFGVQTIVKGASTAATFAENCNQAAALAETPYLLFLNDDTEVTPGFLEPLVAVLDAHPNVAAVGSKLLYPDGRIQHAGVFLTYDPWSGIIAGNHHHDDQPAGLVPAVTAACLLIRRSVYQELGGFDEAFRNGGEDTDLCLRLYEAGWGVYYEPASVVTHHESASGPERWAHVGENVALFSNRWQHLVTGEGVRG